MSTVSVQNLFQHKKAALFFRLEMAEERLDLTSYKSYADAECRGPTRYDAVDLLGIGP
jgi:hypothetical protein